MHADTYDAQTAEGEIDELVALIAAERDRADHYLKRLAEAEQRIVDAPHAEWCPSTPGYDLRRPHLKCACWKSEATA